MCPNGFIYICIYSEIIHLNHFWHVPCLFSVIVGIVVGIGVCVDDFPKMSINRLDMAYIKQLLIDQFCQKWISDMDMSSRGQFYSSFKKELNLEKYLLRLPRTHRIQICKLRCSNTKFPVETGRWTNTPRDERICNLCHDGSIADEFHYICICSNEEVKKLRLKYIPRYYYHNPSKDKIIGLLTFCNCSVLSGLALFFAKISKLL